MPSYDFSGRVAVVTGGARGQGRAHALGFARHGADVVLLDAPGTPDVLQYDLATERALAATADRVAAEGVDVLARSVDVRDESAVRAAVADAVDEFGRVDVLVNNAGVWHVSDAVEIAESAWDVVVDVALRGAWLCAKHVAPVFRTRGGGRIVNTASTAALVGTAGSAHYAAAKHGLLGLTKALALELARDGVTVNAVCPTGVDTPLVAGIAEALGEGALEAVSDRSGSMNVIDEQLLAPEDVTGAVLWLASDAARYVTGVALPVDAGMTAK